MTGTEIRTAWLYLRELWPHYELPERAHEEAMREQAWARVLGDLPLETIQTAIDSLSSERFAPAPGRIREIADRLVVSSSGEGAPDPDEAWAEVKRAVGKYGRDGEPRWSHPAVEAAVGAMGWRDFCGSAIEAEGTWRAHFLRFYGSAAVRNDRQVGVGPAPAVTALAERLRADRALGSGGPA